MGKKKVLFVGSFKNKAKDGSVGGQMFACSTIVNSELSSSIDWTLIDSTADSNLSNSIVKRIGKAVKRIIIFVYSLLTIRFDTVLIFTADGWSFWEKGTMAILAKAFSKSKVVIAPRSGIIVNDINARGRLASFIPYVFKHVDVIICQSNHWKEYFFSLTQDTKSEKFVVVENWIDVLPYKSISNTVVNGSPVNVLFLSWVDKNKGIFELIEAIRVLANEGLNFRLTIAGNGSAFDEVKLKIDEYQLNGKVLLYGWALGKEKIELLQQSHVFVLPSYFEGYPNSLMEAMASSKACIATSVGSIPDIIEDGVNGFLVPAKDALALQAKLRELILNNDLRNQFAKKGKQKILNDNTIEIAVVKMMDVLKS